MLTRPYTFFLFRLSGSVYTFFLFRLSASVSSHGGHTDDDTESSHSKVDLRAKSLILVKIWCMIIVFARIFAGGILPYFFKWNQVFLVLGTQFAGGVFLGMSLMHFLSDANETFGDLASKSYPFTFMLAMFGYLITMLADCVV